MHARKDPVEGNPSASEAHALRLSSKLVRTTRSPGVANVRFGKVKGMKQTYLVNGEQSPMSKIWMLATSKKRRGYFRRIFFEHC